MYNYEVVYILQAYYEVTKQVRQVTIVTVRINTHQISQLLDNSSMLLRKLRITMPYYAGGY